jgi:hypothetical protein
MPYKAQAVSQDSLEEVLPGNIYIKCSPSPNINDERADDRYMEFNKNSETVNNIFIASTTLFTFIIVFLFCMFTLFGFKKIYNYMKQKQGIKR